MHYSQCSESLPIFGHTIELFNFWPERWKDGINFLIAILTQASNFCLLLFILTFFWLEWLLGVTGQQFKSQFTTETSFFMRRNHSYLVDPGVVVCLVSGNAVECQTNLTALPYIQCLSKKESSSLHSTILTTGFSKPSFALKS